MEYLSENQLAEVVAKLTTASRQERLIWKQSNGSVHSFSAASGNFGYLLRSKDNDDFHPFVFSLHKRLEDGSAEKLQEITTGDGVLEREIQELYSFVKRKVLNLDGVAEDLLSEISKLAEGEAP